MPLQATSGAASYDAFGGGVPVAVNYIEDVFSTYLYTGTGASQTITNGIDLSTKGGLVWLKDRLGATSHQLYDTQRGVEQVIYSNRTDASSSSAETVTAFNTTGFTVGQYGVNSVGQSPVSWTFRKQPKFFDIQTWTNGVVNHNLGSVPGCIIYKSTTASENWFVISRKSDGTYETFYLNTTGATQYTAANAAAAGITSTTFDSTILFGGTGTLVGYFFAHDAGGFGLTGTDNVISCGSFTQPSSGDATITLGYEPQWVLIKRSDATSNWFMYDTMRSMSLTNDAELLANTSAAEGLLGGGYVYPTATGFVSVNGNFSAGNYIYIAIRRGPMKVPTSGTSVFSPFTTAAATGTAVTTNFPVDFQLYKYRAGIDYWFDVDRLRGVNSTTTANSTPWLDTTSTAAEATATNVSRNWGNTGFEVPGIVGGASNVFYSFQRAPGFFDEVCYTGNGSTQSITHNLTVLPELLIVKRRSGTATGWTALVTNISKYGYINETLRFFDAPPEINLFGDNVNYVPPTSTAFTIGINNGLNASGSTYVAYLFATCAGVSKVGSYTGTATTLQVDCGFTGGARFVLIKRTDTTGGWYVWDTARGIVSGNDNYLLLNSTAAEVTNTDYIDTYSAGFEISSTAPAAINASGGSFIFFAVA